MRSIVFRILHMQKIKRLNSLLKKKLPVDQSMIQRLAESKKSLIFFTKKIKNSKQSMRIRVINQLSDWMIDKNTLSISMICWKSRKLMLKHNK